MNALDVLCAQLTRDLFAIAKFLFVFTIWRETLEVRFCALEERRNRCVLIEMFKMFYGYTEIHIMVLFTLDSNDKGLCGHSKKICKSRFNTDIRKYFFSQIESLTDGTVWTRTLLMHPA